jgi:RNA polymerase sigma-70 factor (ECF subfamily)
VTEDLWILTGLRAGEPGAARALWIRFSPLVFRVLRQVVGPSADNEDLAQDVFLTVLKRIHRLREPEALGAFIYSVARFAGRNEHRKRSRYRRLKCRLGEASSRLVVTTDVDGREALLRFATLLVRLNSQERLAFALRFIERRKFPEIASTLGVSLSTAKRRATRARNRIALLVASDPVLTALQG